MFDMGDIELELEDDPEKTWDDSVRKGRRKDDGREAARERREVDGGKKAVHERGVDDGKRVNGARSRRLAEEKTWSTTALSRTPSTSTNDRPRTPYLSYSSGADETQMPPTQSSRTGDESGVSIHCDLFLCGVC